jgi:hypothetical protein
MLYGVNILLTIKYIALIGIFVCIVLTPAYLACVNKTQKYDMMRIRVGSWLFGWSFIGWLFALFLSAKKS